MPGLLADLERDLQVAAEGRHPLAESSTTGRAIVMRFLFDRLTRDLTAGTLRMLAREFEAAPQVPVNVLAANTLRWHALDREGHL